MRTFWLIFKSLFEGEDLVLQFGLELCLGHDQGKGQGVGGNG